MNDEKKKEEESKESFDKAQDREKKDEGKEQVEEKPEEKKEETKKETLEEKTEEPKAEPKAETKPEEPKEPKKEESKPEPSGKFKELIKEIEGLSVIELSELVKALEDRFGVSAAAPVVQAAAGAAPAGEAGGESGGKTSFDIELTASGEKKIDCIKAIREINPELGLKEAKDLVDGAPKIIKKEVKKEEAEQIKKKIETVGAKVTLK